MQRSSLDSFIRNPQDALARAVACLALIFLVLNLLLFRHWLLWILILGLLAYAVFRLVSTNSYARSQEDRFFLERVAGPLGPWFINPKEAAEERKNFKHLSCPHCKQKVRVPRGKGRIRVHCPKCGEHFEAQS